jgi:CRISPR-associated protein Cas1
MRTVPWKRRGPAWLRSRRPTWTRQEPTTVEPETTPLPDRLRELIAGANATEHHVPTGLTRLTRRVVAGVFRPGPVRHKEVPKPDGGVRTLSIPRPLDRLVQRAVLAAVTPRAEHLLLPEVHGFRPRRNTDSAIRHLLTAPARPRLALLQVDVANLFDTLPHEAIRRGARKAWEDPLWLSLTETWLRTWAISPETGVPQGAPLSPLYANLALDDILDRPLLTLAPRLGLLRWVRYGDDLSLVLASELSVPAALNALQGLLQRAGMTCKPAKTVLCAGARGSAVPAKVLGHLLTLTQAPGGWRLVRCPKP